MATVWKGAINFGLINVPVKLSAATAKESVAFKMLHSKCNTPINQKRWCPKCGKEVDYADIIKGYEYEKGKFALIKDEDLDAIAVMSSKYIQLVDFIMLDEIDPIYFDKAYHLLPEAAGEKPYLLLYNAMKKTRRAAIGKIAIRDKEHLCVVRVYKDSLVLSTMYFADEVRTPEVSLERIEKKNTLSKIESQMAVQIIENLTAGFDIDKYHDEYRAQLLKIVRAKIDGEEVAAAEKIEMDNAFGDLLEKLKASVEATKNLSKTEIPKPVRKVKTAAPKAKSAK